MPNLENILITWYKDDNLIKLNSSNNLKIHNHVHNSNQLTSELIIENSKPTDSASYTCKHDSVHKNSMITVVNEGIKFD